MNLHGLAIGLVGIVNPQVNCTVQFSIGVKTILADGTEVSQYGSPVNMMAQVQPLTWRDLQQMDGLNLQGTRRAIYLYGDVEGIVRVTQQGGDLITFPGKVAGLPPGTKWLTAQALETWPDWCKIAATLQNGS